MSIRAQIISFLIRRTMKSRLANIDQDVVGFREQMKGSSRLSGALPEDIKLDEIDAGGVPAEWVSHGEYDDQRVLLYFHGGGYVFGGPDSHRDLAWRLAAESRCRVLVVDYRLAPEHVFPAAVDDATASYRWLLDQGFTPDNIMVGGDSAGGGLTMALLLNLKNLGLPQPAGAILLSPWLDLTASGDSVSLNADADAMLTPEALTKFADFYMGDLDRRAPLASPLFGELGGLPPVLVQVGSTEILLSDAERLVSRIRDTGGEAQLEVWPKMPHVFQLLAGRIPEGKAAITKLAAFVLARTAA